MDQVKRPDAREIRDARAGRSKKVEHRQIHACHRRHVVIIKRQVGRGGGNLGAEIHQSLDVRHREKRRAERCNGVSADPFGMRGKSAAFGDAVMTNMHNHAEVLRRGGHPSVRDLQPFLRGQRHAFARSTANESASDAIFHEGSRLALDHGEIEAAIGVHGREWRGDQARES